MFLCMFLFLFLKVIKTVVNCNLWGKVIHVVIFAVKMPTTLLNIWNDFLASRFIGNKEIIVLRWIWNTSILVICNKLKPIGVESKSCYFSKVPVRIILYVTHIVVFQPSIVLHRSDEVVLFSSFVNSYTFLLWYTARFLLFYFYLLRWLSSFRIVSFIPHKEVKYVTNNTKVARKQVHKQFNTKIWQ